MRTVDFGTSDRSEKSKYRDLVGLALKKAGSPLKTIHGDTYKTFHYSNMFLAVYRSGNAIVVLTQDTKNNQVNARYKVSSKSGIEEKAITATIQKAIDSIVATRAQDPIPQ